jgi:hypothetical protein
MAGAFVCHSYDKHGIDDTQPTDQDERSCADRFAFTDACG